MRTSPGGRQPGGPPAPPKAERVGRCKRCDGVLGGRVGLCTWTPNGSIGDFFRTVGAHLPPAPAFVDSPMAWGDEAHVRELFEGTGVDLDFERQTWPIGHDSVDAAVECYTTMFGPTIQARRLAEAEGRWPALRDDMARLFERHNTTGQARVLFPAEYLMVFGRKTTTTEAGAGRS